MLVPGLRRPWLAAVACRRASSCGVGLGAGLSSGALLIAPPLPGVGAGARRGRFRARAAAGARRRQPDEQAHTGRKRVRNDVTTRGHGHGVGSCAAVRSAMNHPSPARKRPGPAAGFAFFPVPAAGSGTHGLPPFAAARRARGLGDVRLQPAGAPAQPGAHHAWADIDVQLQRRHDLVPSPDGSVGLRQARKRDPARGLDQRAGAKAQNAACPAQRGRSLAGTRELGRLIALKESHPDLKGHPNLNSCNATWVGRGTASRYARRFYNGAVRDYK